LYKRLGIDPMDQYYSRRLLRWAGHLYRACPYPGTAAAAHRLGRASPTHWQPANGVWTLPEEGASPMWASARFRCVEKGYRKPSGMEEIA